ncbi:MAG: ankyrin repeat domain-containing protein, partial [Synergistaceae bacterium]|nr:ankyrin repeat domain-containing protein [Synergistaceae bacterium]
KFIRLCRKGELKAVKKALENGANVNAWEEKGRTVLIEAAKKGNLELVQLLIRFNADVNARDDKEPKDKNIFAGTKALKILTSTGKPKKPATPQNSDTPSFMAKVLSIFKR